MPEASKAKCVADVHRVLLERVQSLNEDAACVCRNASPGAGVSCGRKGADGERLGAMQDKPAFIAPGRVGCALLWQGVPVGAAFPDGSTAVPVIVA